MDIAKSGNKADSGLQDWLFILLICTLVWALNVVWLSRDSRPPVWDMALHQTYALNYLQGPAPGAPPSSPWVRSGNYPPFVHLMIAFLYFMFHPSPHVATLANLPATLLLSWAVYQLAFEMAGRVAARWACALTALTPYLAWMSRETVLDYWLSAWVAVSCLLLWRTRGFRAPHCQVLLGCAWGLGLLTKWLFAGFVVFPVAYVVVRNSVWKNTDSLIRLLDSFVIAGLIAGIWYLPNLPAIIRYFGENARIGATEGEPPVLSFQSLIYYLRLLEGYQLLALLFVLVLISCVAVYRRSLLRDGGYLVATIAGGWAVMTLLRTKDPRFTMPLIGLLLVAAGAYIQSWGSSLLARTAKVGLLVLLCGQLYATNFGISWLPQEVILARGYQGSLRWDWNLYLQHYYHILGAPRREDWKQNAILETVLRHSERNGLRNSLALVPDLPRFNAANFSLYARLMRARLRIDHLQSAAAGIQPFEGFDYVLMTEGDQGMSWTTRASRALNRVIVDEHEVFRLVEIYLLPNGDSVRLYWIRRPERMSG